MENRIEINGVWYVREEDIKDDVADPLDHLELTFSEECCYETSKYCFVASRIKKNTGDEFYPDISITFTDKRSGDRDTWKEEYWDSNNWFRGILEGSVAMDICSQGEKQFKAFLNRLVGEGWLLFPVF